MKKDLRNLEILKNKVWRETMETMDLVIAYVYLDEDDYFELDIYEDIVELSYVENLLTDDKKLVFVCKDGKQNELDLSDLEWYKCVPQTSHLSKYAKSAEKANYEWDDCGNLVSE
ncbi:hypothetical protein PKB74_002609 [Enterococcus faecalis]|nr:hypothetical protein [Enterococcus faecalis]EHB5047276.1 hypothetical protein [Enterococcus faecalis]EHM3170443.1 hypothetical protein [Enterococcus faecalis]EIM5504035.1 hypothetical protein [Enterococcus faecalis]EJG4538818.1 hypothetical protein [Enterococcus faecalis]